MAVPLVLEAHGVGVAFATSAPIFQGASLRLVPGWYGLVGANGAGKTTLLRVLAGELTPSDGTLRRDPRGAHLVLCNQDAEEATDDVLAFARDDGAIDPGLAAELRGRLDLVADGVDRWPTLSPGERKRWQIGAALATEPDVLFLDEPTNHLDVEGRRLLVGALRRFRGIGVIVSHDRALLNELPRHVIRVHGGQVTVHAGNYEQVVREWQADQRTREEEHARAKDRVRTVTARLADARRDRAAADRNRSAAARMKDKNDNDARSMGAKVVASWAEARSGRTVAVVRAELERAERDVPSFTRDRTIGGHVFAKYERSPSAVLFHVDEDHIDAPDVAGRDARITILNDVRVTIARDDRVRVIGPNGAGKTTLLSALRRSGAGLPHPERVLYLPQELGSMEIARLAGELRDLDREARGRVLSVFAALGSDPERIVLHRGEDAARLSPGEARKLALSMGLGRHAWALVLDEPTNHLDLPSVERLEAALLGYPGCVVLVTHDDAFAAACTSRVLYVDGGTVV